MNTKLYLYNGVSPFTRISGNRYLPFFDKYDVNIDEKENEYIASSFWEVLDKDYTFSQSSIMNGVLRISSKLVKEKYDPLIINYCLIQIKDKKYYYFIEQARYTQDDTIEYILYLDSFATYFKDVNWNAQFKVNRTTFDIQANWDNEFWKEIFKCILYNRDDSIGNIPLTKTLIFYNHGSVEGFNKKKFYAYVIPNSNTIEHNVMFKQPLDEGYLLDVTDKKNKFNKETSDNQIFYEVVGPDLGDNIPKEIISEQITSFSSLMSKLKDKNVERPQFKFIIHSPKPNNMHSRIKLELLEVIYKGVTYPNGFNLTWGYSYGINIPYDKVVILDGLDVKDSEFCREWFLKGCPISLKEKLILDGEGKSNFVRINEDYNFYPKQHKQCIPINNQLMKFSIYNWYGEKIDLEPTDILSKNGDVNCKFYGMGVMNGIETYLSFKNVMSTYKFETYDNVIKFNVFKKISHRTDSKQEFLQSQRNTIETQKSNTLISFLGNLLSNIISNGTSSGLANSIGNTMLGGGYAARMTSEGILSTINYTNSIRMINAKIKDSGLQRSTVSDETTGSLEHLISDTSKFNKWGWCFAMRLPDKVYEDILDNHFNKYGYQIDRYLTLTMVMHLMHKDISKRNFQYIKSDDFASLQMDSYIPQEAFNDLNGLLSNGVHIWFITKNLDYFKKNFPTIFSIIGDYDEV